MTKNETTPKPQTRGTLTAKAIHQAIVRIEKGRPKVVKPGRRLSIKSVAEEAGVSRATIHNNYPRLAERIRESRNKAVRSQRNEKDTALKALRAKYSALRYDLIQARKLNQDMASEMATLVTEIERMRAVAGSPNVAVIHQKSRKSVT
jgi:DNA-binding transcriptional MocR family regulator